MDSSFSLLCLLLPLLSYVLLASPSEAAAVNRPRIVNGTDVPIDHIPFQISLEFFGSHTCGGAILSADTILTAAHCLDYFSEHHSLSTLRVRVGSSYLQREGSVYNLSSIVIHESYDPATYDYDIAVLKLSSPLRFTNAVQPALLASDRSQLQDDEMVQVSGWGRIRTGGPLADILQRIDMPVINQKECERLFKQINVITGRMFCAGYVGGDGDSCNGDSGGPLVNSNNVLYGLVSWGPSQCAHKGYTGVYTNVAYFHDWIQGNL